MEPDLRKQLHTTVKKHKRVSIFKFKWLLALWALSTLLLQSGCIIIGVAGEIVETTVETGVSIVGHTAKTAVDVVTPDGDNTEDQKNDDE